MSPTYKCRFVGGGVLDGQVKTTTTPGKRVQAPIADGAKVVGWDDGPLYEYPYDEYRLVAESGDTNGEHVLAFEYIGRREP